TICRRHCWWCRCPRLRSGPRRANRSAVRRSNKITRRTRGGAMNILYTAEAVVEGGRAGRGRTSDGRLTVELSVPQEMGGEGGPGTNPEQLFAVGYAACFQSALLAVARGRQLDAPAAKVTARVGLGASGHGRCGLGVRLHARP